VGVVVIGEIVAVRARLARARRALAKPRGRS